MAKCEILEEINEPIIYCTLTAMYKMRYYIDNCDKEIGWLGYVDRLNKYTFLIKDVFLLKQEVHSATTEISPDALAEMANNLIAKGDEGIEIYNSIRMWGHSHVNMSPSPSVQDNDQMKEFTTTGFYIRLIGNKRGEWNVSLWDFDNNILWTDVPLKEYYTVDISDEELAKEIKDNVVEKTFATKTTTTTSYGKSYYQDGKWLKEIEDDDGYYYNYGYGVGTLPKKNESTNASTNTEDSVEYIEEPYEIVGDYVSEADFKAIKKWYSSDAMDCLFFATGEPADVEDVIFQDYGVHLKPEIIQRLQKEMAYIYDNKYGYNDKGGKK